DLQATSYQGAAVAALQMQKLSRLVYALDGNLIAVVVAHVAVLGLAIWALRRQRDPFRDVAVTLAVACLLSPIGWLHTFTLLYPLWVFGLAITEPQRPWWRTSLWILAGVLTSGYLSKIPWPQSMAWMAGHNDTVGTLLLLTLVATAPRPAAEPIAA